MFGRIKKESFLQTETARNSVIPSVNSRQVIEALERSRRSQGQCPYVEPLMAGLCVMFYVEYGQQFQIVTAETMHAIGIASKDIRRIAIDNFVLLRGNVHFDDFGSFKRVVLREQKHRSASLLLDETFWNELARTIEGDIVVAVPSCDFIAFCSSKSSGGIDQLQTVATEILDNEEREQVTETLYHGLTDALLVWRAGCWNLYSEIN